MFGYAQYSAAVQLVDQVVQWGLNFGPLTVRTSKRPWSRRSDPNCCRSAWQQLHNQRVWMSVSNGPITMTVLKKKTKTKKRSITGQTPDFKQDNVKSKVTCTSDELESSVQTRQLTRTTGEVSYHSSSWCFNYGCSAKEQTVPVSRTEQ